MHITTSQLSALNRHNEQMFIDRLIVLMNEVIEEESRTEAIRGECRDLIARARHTGFDSEFEIAAYVICGCCFGRDFDSRPDLPFRNILDSANRDAGLKAETLLAAMEEHAQQLEIDQPNE